MKRKINVVRPLRKNRFRVAIFGSARIKMNDQIYKNIFSLAKMLGERDIDVVTGGGPGIMEAANAGHMAGSMKTKARSIGLGIKLPMEQKFNKSVDYKETFMRFTSRLDKFMLLSNAVVVAPGGVGTLLELFYTWQLVQVEHVKSIPIILLGDMWPELIKWLEKYPYKKKYFTKEDLARLFLAKDSKEVMKVIDKAFSEYKCSGDIKGDFCLRHKEYRVK